MTQEIQLKLSVGDVNNIIEALAEFPYKISAELIEKIRGQAIQQVAANQSNHTGDKHE